MEESEIKYDIKDEPVEEAAAHEAASNLLALKQPMTSVPNCHLHTLLPQRAQQIVLPQRADSAEVRTSPQRLGHIELVRPSTGQANSVMKNGGKKMLTLGLNVPTLDIFNDCYCYFRWVVSN